MTKKTENSKLTICVPPKLDNIIRRQAFNEKITLGEVVEKYREAYLREKEREKLEKTTKEEKEREKNN